MRAGWPSCCEYIVLRSSFRSNSTQRNCPNPGTAAPGGVPVAAAPGPIPGAGRGGPGGRGGFGGPRGGFAGAPVNRAATCYKCGGPNHFARDCQAQAMKCYACGKLGHISRDCTAPNGGTSNAVGKTCYRCGETGHISRECPQAEGAGPANGDVAPPPAGEGVPTGPAQVAA